MGHYDNCRPGYCGNCGAAPGNMINGKCEFCHPPKKEKEFKSPKSKKSDQFGQWIKCSDRLPEDGQDVGFIVVEPEFYADGVTRNRGAYLNGRKLGGHFDRKMYDLGVGGFSVPGHGYNASHWCALPDAPK